MKPPIATPVPLCITQAAVPPKITSGEVGLEIVQVVSVGKKPDPRTDTSPPGALMAGLNSSGP